MRHFCISVRGMLKWDKSTTKRNMRDIKKDDGSRFKSVGEFKEYLLNELLKGHEVLPLGNCDNFDFKTGCLGHEE
jgi:hypothetical protein